jgi:hypothetical protein
LVIHVYLEGKSEKIYFDDPIPGFGLLIRGAEASLVATICSSVKWRVCISKLYCVEWPFPGGGKSSDSRIAARALARCH